MTLQDYFLRDAALTAQWSTERNGQEPTALPLTSREKYWWRCDKGHEWQASLDSRVYGGRGCPGCSGQQVFTGDNDLATVAPEAAKRWHSARNGDLTPDSVTAGSRKKVWWQCEQGHEWQAPVYSLTSGYGCPYCAGKLAIPGQTDLATTHPHLMEMWSDQNTILATQVTAGSHKKVWWRCRRGHEWEAIIGNITLEGCGCPYCSGRRAIPGETDLATVCPEITAQWDPEKNGELKPEQVLPSAHDKVWWRCGLGHSWQAVVFSRTREKGSSCPYCTGRKVLAGFNDLATKKPGLAKEWYQPLNGELKPEDVTLGSNKKVYWHCQDGHVWRAAIYARTRARGSGCPVCMGTVKVKKAVELPKRRAVERSSEKRIHA